MYMRQSSFLKFNGIDMTNMFSQITCFDPFKYHSDPFTKNTCYKVRSIFWFLSWQKLSCNFFPVWICSDCQKEIRFRKVSCRAIHECESLVSCTGKLV